MKKKVFICAMILSAGLLSVNMNAVAAPVSSSEPVVMSSSESDWDSILDSYEKYVNQYIAVYKKVQAGDMSAYTSMVSLMEKYQKLAKQLEEAQDEMTTSQLARYTKITAKLANALK